MRAALAIALTLTVALAVATGSRTAAAPGSPAAKPAPLRLKQRCVTAAERRRVVRFPASDGTRLIGVLLGRGDRAVALAHQGASTLCIWLPYARSLAAAGYRVLVYDQRRHGSSGWPRSASRLFRVDLDAVGAARELRRRGARRIVLMGASLGAAAVVGAGAAVQPPVDGVVSVSSPSVFVNVSPARAASRLSVPTLFVAAEDDDPFDDDARALYAAAPAAEKELLIVPGPLHGVALLRVPLVRERVNAWLAARLRPSS